MAQLVKNPPAMQETWVWSLGWEDPLEKGKATHTSILGLENSMDCIVRGVSKSRTWLSGFCFHFQTDMDEGVFILKLKELKFKYFLPCPGN